MPATARLGPRELRLTCCSCRWVGGRCPGQHVRVVGTLAIHQAPPTAKGFHFLTLEDELGMINVIVQPRIAMRDRQAMRGGMVQVEGTVQQEGDVVNVVASRVTALTKGG